MNVIEARITGIELAFDKLLAYLGLDYNEDCEIVDVKE
jgi:hypothetical protein